MQLDVHTASAKAARRPSIAVVLHAEGALDICWPLLLQPGPATLPKHLHAVSRQTTPCWLCRRLPGVPNNFGNSFISCCTPSTSCKPTK